MFNFFGITDRYEYRLLFLVVSVMSFLVFWKYYIELFKKYFFLKFVTIITIIFVIQVLRSFIRGNDIYAIFSNAHNFLFYPSSFFIIYIAAKLNTERTLNYFVLPFFFLCISFYVSKFITPLHRVEGGREGSSYDYQRIYFHGYQFSILVFFYLLSLLKFVKMDSFSKKYITWSSLILVFFILFFSYFRAFFMGPVMIFLLFYTGSNLKKKILFGAVSLVLIIFLINLFPALADRYLVVLDEGFEDDPTSIGRLFIFLVRYDYLEASNSLIFGDGFMLPKEDYSLYTINERMANPLILDNDNGYAGLLVVMGFFGILTFIIGYLKSSLQYYSFYKQSKIPYNKAVYFTAYVFAIYVLLISFVNDFFIFPYALMPVIFINAIAIATHRNEINFILKNEK